MTSVHHRSRAARSVPGRIGGIGRLLAMAVVGCGVVLPWGRAPAGAAAESLPALAADGPPRSLDAMWDGYDPRREPLESEVLREWEEDGIVCRVVRYRIGTFKGVAARMVACFCFPAGKTGLPALLHLHGGGQSARPGVAEARRGYASLSLNWGGNPLRVGRPAAEWDGPNTDWGAVDATHPPQRSPVNHFAGSLAPDPFTLDAVESPRNAAWFLVLVAARRGISFLETQPEVDAGRIGVHGHSMGGRLATALAAIDGRLRAAVASCGGAGYVDAGRTDVPGCVTSRPSALEAACVADNPHLARLDCPLLWLSPTNDFHAPLDNMAVNWRQLPDDRVRFAITPHMNHRHGAAEAITRHLWFEEHLRGAFAMPATPATTFSVAPDGVPVVAVEPDERRPVRSVDIFYSTDPQPLTRFWRDGGAVREAGRFVARCPVMAVDEPFFAFANVTYELPAGQRGLAREPGEEPTDAFTISSRPLVLDPAALAAAGARATDRPDPLVEDGERGWRDWYRLNWDHPPLWTVATRKLRDPKWRGPDGATLVFEVRCETDNTLIVTVETNGWGAVRPGSPAVEYAAAFDLTGSDGWQRVAVTPGDLVATRAGAAGALADWRGVTQLSLGPSGTVVRDGRATRVEGRPWKGPREIRGLHWEGGAAGPAPRNVTEAKP